MLILSIFLTTSMIQCSKVTNAQIIEVSKGFAGMFIWGTGFYYTGKIAYEIYKALEKYAKKEEINFREIPLFLVKSTLSFYAIYLGSEIMRHADQQLRTLRK